MHLIQQRTHRRLAPTAIFKEADTVYGIVYKPVNQLARDCCRLVGQGDLYPDQRTILEDDIGFNFQVVP